MICVILVLITACGINGQPLSPSEVKLNSHNESILPFNNNNKKKSKKSDNKQSRSYLSIAELGQMGYDYNANFGLKNDNLEDVFECIKPKSALLKKRTAIPLKRDYE